MTPTLIVTRPAPQGERFAQAVLHRWSDPLRIIQAPLLQIAPVPFSVDLSDVSGVIFTSANGVAAVSDVSLPPGLTAWCVGERTATAAQAAGFSPIIGPGDADGLVRMILADPPPGRLIHIRGQHSRGQVASRLRAEDIDCIDIVAYDQKPLPLSAEARQVLNTENHVVFPLFSPRTAALLKNNAPFVASVDVVAISNAVEEAASGLGTRCVVVADKPEMSAMIDATIGCLNALNGRVN